MGKRCEELKYFLSSCLWDLNYNHLLYNKMYVIVIFSSWSKRIFSHFLKLISQLTEATPQVFFRESVLKICSKYKEKHPRRSCDFSKVACRYIEVALKHGRSPVNFLYIFGTPFYNNTSGELLLNSKRFERPFISLYSIQQLH